MKEKTYVLTKVMEAPSRTAMLEISLKFGQNVEFKDKVHFIRNEHNQEEFKKMVEKYEIDYFPALICGTKVLKGAEVKEATQFFTEVYKN